MKPGVKNRSEREPTSAVADARRAVPFVALYRIRSALPISIQITDVGQVVAGTDGQRIERESSGTIADPEKSHAIAAR